MKLIKDNINYLFFILFNMRKMHVKRKKKFNLLIFLSILIILTLFLSFKILNKKSRNIFLEYSIIQTKKVVSKIIIDSINNDVLNSIDTNNLFIVLKNTNNKIESIDINSKYINSILNNSSKLLDNNLNKLEKEKAVFYLPLFNNSILSNIFPKVPVKINTIGSTLCVIDTKVESYGMNNALFKVSLDIKVDVRILLPFVSDITTIDTSIPIVIKLIEGDIPNYFLTDYFNKSYSN